MSSQRDAETADIEKEREEQAKGPEAQARELDELTDIYVARGLSWWVVIWGGDMMVVGVLDKNGESIHGVASPMFLLYICIHICCYIPSTKKQQHRELARRVAEELTRKDVIRAHARDELGIDLDDLSKPLVAAVASMLAFAVGAGMPLLAGAFIASRVWRIVSVALVSSLGLLFFGILGSVLGGAWWLRGAVRVLVGGWLAMAITFGFGFLFEHSSSTCGV